MAPYAARSLRIPPGDGVRRLLPVQRHSDAVPAGVARRPRARCARDRHRAGGAHARPHPCRSARHPPHRSPCRGGDRGGGSRDIERRRIRGDGIRLWFRRDPCRLWRDLGAVLAGVAACGFVGPSRIEGARPRLRAGAPVGIGRVHRREPRRRSGARRVGSGRARLGAHGGLGGDCGGRLAVAARHARWRGRDAHFDRIRPVALRCLRRDGRRGEPDPGEPRGALRLCDPAPAKGSAGRRSGSCGRSVSSPRSCCSRPRRGSSLASAART
jgi:hypothetical protein